MRVAPVIKYIEKETIHLDNDYIRARTKEGEPVKAHCIGVNSNGYYAIIVGGGCDQMPCYEVKIYVDKNNIRFDNDAINATLNSKKDHVSAHCLVHGYRGYYLSVFPEGTSQNKKKR